MIKINKYKKSIINLLDLPIDEDDYKSIITMGTFNSNYTQYESMRGGGGGGEGKDKNLSVEEYLDRIKPYLSDIINNHKTQGRWRIDYPGNKIIEHKTQSKWKLN